jgi:hypothetical protein
MSSLSSPSIEFNMDDENMQSGDESPSTDTTHVLSDGLGLRPAPRLPKPISTESNDHDVDYDMEREASDEDVEEEELNGHNHHQQIDEHYQEDEDTYNNGDQQEEGDETLTNHLDIGTDETVTEVGASTDEQRSSTSFSVNETQLAPDNINNIDAAQSLDNIVSPIQSDNGETADDSRPRGDEAFQRAVELVANRKITRTPSKGYSAMTMELVSPLSLPNSSNSDVEATMPSVSSSSSSTAITNNNVGHDTNISVTTATLKSESTVSTTSSTANFTSTTSTSSSSTVVRVESREIASNDDQRSLVNTLMELLAKTSIQKQRLDLVIETQRASNEPHSSTTDDEHRKHASLLHHLTDKSKLFDKFVIELHNIQQRGRTIPTLTRIRSAARLQQRLHDINAIIRALDSNAITELVLNYRSKLNRAQLDQLFKSLEQNSSLTSLSFNHTKLRDGGVTMLAYALGKRKSLQVLELADGEFSEHALRLLSDSMVGAGLMVDVLNISHNRFTDNNSSLSLSSSVDRASNTPTINSPTTSSATATAATTTSVNQPFVDRSLVRTLAQMVSQVNRYLDLSHCSLDSRFCRAVFSAAHNLETLKIRGNQMGTEAMEALVPLLQSSQCQLIELDLAENGIDSFMFQMLTQ